MKVDLIRLIWLWMFYKKKRDQAKYKKTFYFYVLKKKEFLRLQPRTSVVVIGSVLNIYIPYLLFKF